MGKLSGISGMMRGRVGSMVYSKGENGSTYVRQYQPQVLNPRTPEQLVQRAKMNLAGQLSSLTSREIVRAMSAGNNRQCRGMFVNRLLREMTVAYSSGDYTAKIDVPKMVFSRGGAQLSAQAGTPTLTETELVMSLTLVDAAKAGLYGERIVAVSIVPRTVSEVDFICSGDFLLQSTDALSCTVQLPHPLMAGQRVYVFRCPYELNEGEASVIAQRMAGAVSGEEVSAILSSHLATATSIWGDSVYEGIASFHSA